MKYSVVSNDDIDGNKLVRYADNATIPPFDIYYDRYKHYLRTGPTPLPSKQRWKGGPLSTQMRKCVLFEKGRAAKDRRTTQRAQQPIVVPR
jgi:hypothetical protein